MSIEVDDPTSNSIADFENADAAVLGPPFVGRAAGVEKEQPVPEMICRLVTVSIYEGIEILSVKFFEYPVFEPIRRAPAVDETDTVFPNCHDTFQGDPVRMRVHIASNGVYRNPFKSHENIGVDHISCVKDEGNILKVVIIKIIQKG